MVSDIVAAHDPTPRGGGARGRRGGAGLASRRQRHRHCVGWAGRPWRGGGLRARRGHPHAGLDRLRRALRRDRRAPRGRRRPVVGHHPTAVRRGAQLVAPGRDRCGSGRRPSVPSPPGSPHAGVEALLAAADAIAAGTVRPGDRRHQRRAAARHRHVARAGLRRGRHGRCCSGPDEDGAPAVLGPRASRWMAALDRYRGDHEDTTRDVYDGRLFREEMFLPLATETAAALGTDSRWSLPDPDGRLGAALARKIGTDQVVSADVRRALGDTGRRRRAHRPRARPRRAGRGRAPRLRRRPGHRGGRRGPLAGARGRAGGRRPRGRGHRGLVRAGAPGPGPAGTGRRARRDGGAAGQRDVRAGQRRDPRAHRGPLRRLRHRRRSRRRSTLRASPAAATSSTRCRSPAPARSRPS